MHKANMGTLNQLNEEFYVNYKRLVLQNVHKLARDTEQQAATINAVQGITDQHLQTAWSSKKYTVSDNMQTDGVTSLKAQLDQAPFQMAQSQPSLVPSTEQSNFMNLFSMPAISERASSQTQLKHKADVEMSEDGLNDTENHGAQSKDPEK